MLFREAQNSPRSYLTISDLYTKYSSLNDAFSKRYTELLKVTKTFMAKTAPDFKDDRDWQKEDDIKEILDAAATGLDSFHASPEYKTKDGEFIYDFCRQAISARLSELQKDDNIYIYYNKHDSALKTNLSTVATPRNINK